MVSIGRLTGNGVVPIMTGGSRLPVAGTQQETADLNEAQRRLRVRFRDIGLLAEAFVHRSYLNETDAAALRSNERLEFLGDAALGLAVAVELFRQYPDASEGPLTEMRAALVQKSTLATVARRFDLGRFLMLGRGEELDGGRTREINLARVYEAVVGAILLDRGQAAASRFVLRSLRPEFESLTAGYRLDAKSRLQQLVQQRWHQPPVYRTVDEQGPDHARTFRVQVLAAGEVLAEGVGRTKRLAEQLAAADAIQRLGAAGT